ncbi:MAG: hypothetical protein ACTHMY_21760 [Solirubrobacteraceae bacterium]
MITRVAAFGPTDTDERILAEIACPSCGYRDPSDTFRVRPGNRVRFFCDGCGAFVTILLSDAQAEIVRRWESRA